VTFNPSLTLWLTDTADTSDMSEAEMKVEKDVRKTAMGASLKNIKIRVKKSRFGTSDRRCDMIIDFAVGPVKYSGLFKLLKDFGVMNQSGSRYDIPEMFEGKSFYKKEFIPKLMAMGEEGIDKLQEIMDKREAMLLEERKNRQYNSLSDVLEAQSEEMPDEAIEDALLEGSMTEEDTAEMLGELK